MANLSKYEGKAAGELRGLLGRRDDKITDLEAEMDALLASTPMQRTVRFVSTAAVGFLSGLAVAKKPAIEPYADWVLALAGGVGAFLLASEESTADSVAPDIAEGMANVGIATKFRALGAKAG